MNPKRRVKHSLTALRDSALSCRHWDAEANGIRSVGYFSSPPLLLRGSGTFRKGNTMRISRLFRTKSTPSDDKSLQKSRVDRAVSSAIEELEDRALFSVTINPTYD